MAKGEHFFIRGNHDNPSQCKRHPFWVKDGGSAFGNPEIFCIGGALSIDKHLRTDGYDWWHDEELTYRELCSIMDAYELVKPKVVVTHDCPRAVIARVMNIYEDGSVTRRALDNILELHRPELWIHGHFHHDYHMMYKGTEFIGLGELSFVDIEI